VYTHNWYTHAHRTASSRTHTMYVKTQNLKKDETESNVMVDSPRDLKTSEFEVIGTHTHIGPHHHAHTSCT
jgi:hypothetical protein